MNKAEKEYFWRKAAENARKLIAEPNKPFPLTWYTGLKDGHIRLFDVYDAKETLGPGFPRTVGEVLPTDGSLKPIREPFTPIINCGFYLHANYGAVPQGPVNLSFLDITDVKEVAKTKTVPEMHEFLLKRIACS